MREAIVSAEHAVIAAVLREPNLLSEINLDPKHFTETKHQTYWQTIMALREEGEPVDIVTVAERLEVDGRGNELSALAGIMDNSIGVPENAKHYAGMIETTAVSETLWRQVRKALEDRDPGDIVRIAEDIVARRMPGQLTSVTGDLTDSWQEWQDDQAMLRQAPPFRWGLAKVDQQLGRLVPGRLYIIAARPGAGKTASALNIAIHNALTGTHVGFISLEQTKAELAARAVCILSEKSLSQVTGEDATSPIDRRAIMEATAQLKDIPIQFYDASPMDIGRVQSSARSLVDRHGAKILMLDYLQTIKTPSKRDRHEEVGQTIQALKSMAKRLHVPLVVVAQLRRDAENRIPTMADLGESGTIEREADVILALHREFDDDGRPLNACWVMCLKNRHGPAPWKTEVRWHGWCFKYADKVA